jgi:hypothetical protein
MDKEKREKFLLELYDFQIKQGHTNGAQISRQDDNEFRENLAIVNYWEEKGIIEVIAKATGFVVVKLTSYGIDYVENNLV